MFRWGLVACLVALQLVMKAPVWALIARFDVVNGNSGYHRYELINQAILHFGEWFFVGTKSTASWGAYMDDIADAYVTVAKEAGLLGLIFFIGIFWQCFRRLGLARQAAERAGDRKLELQVWSFGAALMATVVAYFGIYYFDQSQTVWWCLLAMISAITSVALASVPDTAKDIELMRPWAPRPVPVASPAGWQAPLAGSSSRLGPAPVSVERAPLSGAYRRSAALKACHSRLISFEFFDGQYSSVQELHPICRLQLNKGALTASGTRLFRSARSPIEKFLYFVLTVLGFSFWFFMAVPFASHRETYSWLAWARIQTFAQQFSFGLSSTYRPLAEPVTWLCFRVLDPRIFPTSVVRQTLFQLFVYAMFVLAWWLIYSVAPQRRLFALVSFVAGGVFFSGYVHLFHINGLMYGRSCPDAGGFASLSSYWRISKTRDVVRGNRGVADVLASLFNSSFRWLLLRILSGYFLATRQSAARPGDWTLVVLASWQSPRLCFSSSANICL